VSGASEASDQGVRVSTLSMDGFNDTNGSRVYLRWPEISPVSSEVVSATLGVSDQGERGVLSTVHGRTLAGPCQ
jgi:hypothetical protein